MSTRNRFWKILKQNMKDTIARRKQQKNGLWLDLKTMFRLIHCIFYVAVFCRDVLFWKSGGTNLAQIAASNCFQETHKLCKPPHLRVWESLSLIDSVRDAVKNYWADFFPLRVYPPSPASYPLSRKSFCQTTLSGNGGVPPLNRKSPKNSLKKILGQK